MRKKALRILLAAAAAMTLLAGCGGPSGETQESGNGTQEESQADGEDQTDDGEQKCGFIVGSFEQIFYQRVSDAIESKAAEIEMNAIVTDAELDSHVASNKIESLVEQGCEAIALSCGDPDGVKDAVEEAAAQGTAIFTFDGTVESDAVVCHVGTDNYKGGQLAGQEILKYSEEGDTVGIIGNSSDPACAEREQGAVDVLDGQNRNVITGIDYEGEPVNARQLMENLLVEHPDIAVVFCVGDPAATGALAAIKEAQADCRIIGFDGNPEALEAIRDTEGNGRWWVSEIAQDPQKIGETLVEQMSIYLEEGSLSSGQIPIDPYVIDLSNVEEEMY